MSEEFNFRPMRRSRQQLMGEECVEILSNAYRGILAVNGDGGYPYALPIDFVYSDGKIYMHCALRGHKIDSLRRDSNACFTVLDIPVQEEGEWWYHVRSVICFGKIQIISPEEPEHEGLLRTLARKYNPNSADIEDDIRRNSRAAFVLEFSIEHMSGKRVKEE